MRIFLTGATGFIGTHVLPELIAHGHRVLGLTRSDAGARAIEAAGGEVHRGELEQPATLRAGAELAEAVIHCAFDHDFTNFVANTRKDVAVIEAMGEALKGSDRPLLITSGVGIGSGAHGEPAREDVFNPAHANPRIASEIAGTALLDAGVNVSVMRLPQVHDTRKQGLISPYIDIVRTKGRVAYVGEGANRWAAGHVSDAAVLYRLAIEGATPGSRWHAVGEEGVSARHRRGRRARTGAAGGVDRCGCGGGGVRLVRDVRRARHARVERDHPRAAGLDAQRPGVAGGPGGDGLCEGRVSGRLRPRAAPGGSRRGRRS